MRRSVGFWTCIWLIAYTLHTFAADWPSAVKAADKQVPRIEVLKAGEDGPGICSGVVLNVEPDHGAVLTAAHCVAGKADELSITVNGRDARVAKVNALIDLAVLRFEPDGEQAMALAPSVPPAGTEVCVVGYGFGISKLAVQFGRVSQAWNEETKALWISLDLLFGDSGGPAIDEQGRLIGISSRIYSSGPAHMAAFVPVDRVKAFVSPYLPKK